ncbi:amidohydrolase family protein [Planktothrix sp. FACHB-1355]|uniref:Amidohydrolase family protein n=1 Tax=Aerosakkonema funiforme FACHB-1375 TaxID=2949571 RepID=A0A926ZKG9_9CYAN|nr:amidohydrolase family protein [Aerosakkonema funiforme]MBD2185362.1 amidohydrolase family protein [Aerosakkonema funiforme FACHB-1375]MBD3559025.1 amidohydrolase family protein [Planktothrix sp. FACHB-1355]
MSETPVLDRIIKNVRVVRPHSSSVESLDLGIRDGKFTQIAPQISPETAKEVFDAENLLGFPGVVDAHTHIGIYQPLDRDAIAESQAAAMGGVTTTLNYIRTGQYYLNKGGSYKDFFPEVLALSEGNFFVDYGYHIAPISPQHIDEMQWLFEEHGVASFKIFMFYGGYGLHGLSDQQNLFLMINKDDRYDLAHFEFIMRGLTKLREKYPTMQDRISLSLHCEMADILNAYTKIVQQDSTLTGLTAYSAARPPHSEGLAICIASYLAHETNCININLLHLSSRKAVEAALMMQTTFPHVNFKREVTVGHLLLDVNAATGKWAKVNPPIRPREDVEYLWNAVLQDKIDWIVSDHACCSAEQKASLRDPDNIWLAKSGFGGTEYLLSGVISEGSKRGLSYNQIAKLLCWNPAQRFGVLQKGDIAVGYDADLVLVDPHETFVVRAAESLSQQGYTPFEGMELTGRVKSTFLRGDLIYDRGQILGSPQGRYLKRNQPT